MRGTICKGLMLSAVAGLALSSAGQAARNRTTTIEMGNSGRAGRLPYTAEYKILRVRTLVDGSAIRQESTQVVALDSEGRRMTATTKVAESEDETATTRVNVFDPVSHANISWVSPGQDATVASIPIPGTARPACGGYGVAGMEGLQNHVTPTPMKPTVEDLGTETIQGVEARGRRTTSTIPAGAIGNNEPLVRTSEMWTAIAPGLRGLVVREITDDPQSGKMSKELASFRQGEPDETIFQVPAGYEVVNREVSTCPGAEKAGPAPLQ